MPAAATFPPASSALAPALRVLLVDDHDLVRMGFRLLLESTAGIEVVEEVNSGESALDWLRRWQATPEGVAGELPVDVVIMDVSMQGISGIEATRQLLARAPGLRVLALSAHEDPSHVRHLLAAGGLGYLSKRADPQVLVEAVRCVARGERFLDAALAQRMALQALAPAPQGTAAGEAAGRHGVVATLSEREFEVFLHLARGLSAADIATQLHISPRTVGTHLYHVKQKTGARNQAEITLLAIQQGLLQV